MPKILIVDDSEMLRAELKAAFQKADFRFIEACDGMEGLSIARKADDIDLVVTDINMPVMDGITMCREIKALPRYEKLPIIILSTESARTVKEMAKEIGVVLWIIKPSRGDKIVSMINKVLERKKTLAP